MAAGITAALVMGCGGPGHLVIIKPAPTPEVTQPVKVMVFPELATSPSPTPVIVLTPAAGPSAITYVVKKGDTLKKIAKRFTGSSYEAKRIALENNIKDGSSLEAGQRIIITTRMKKGKPLALQTASTNTFTPTPSFAHIENHAFAVGEKYVFSVEWMGVSGGTATMEDKEMVSINGRLCHHIVCQAFSSPFFSTFFTVKDQIDSYMDADGLFPWRYEKRLNEGSFKADIFVTYDQYEHVAIEKNKTITLPPESQDVVSCFYYYRALPLSEDKPVYIKTYADGKNWELQVQFIRRETVKVPAGEFKCIVVKPLLKFAGVFQQKGDVMIWLTDDAHHIPVLVKSRIIIGSIDIVLKEASVVE